MKCVCAFLFSCLFACNVFAETGDFQPDDSFQSIDEILDREPDNTPCATGVFANALAMNANNVSESDDEETVKQWIRNTFSQSDVLNAVLACPEFSTIDEEEHIKLQPIKYTFAGGREIVVNYETQPKILKQRANLSSKRNTNSLNDPSPMIGDPNDSSIWTNTDPAWYAIAVVQHGAFDNFVGPDKNNTIALSYIYDNIDTLYPQNSSCTNRSAWADDDKPVNKATKQTVGLKKDDTNDYYVAGDANLQWISYLEIAGDVVLTVVTMGGGAIITGATKSARALRAMNGLRKTMQTLRQSPKVVKYVRMEQRLQKAERTTRRIKEFQRLEKELSKLDKVRNASKYEKTAKDLEKVSKELKEFDGLTDSAKYADKLKDLEQETETVSKSMKEAAKADKDVKKYTEASKSYGEIRDYIQAYRNLRKVPKTGNVVTRLWKAARATAKGNKQIKRGARIARSSMKSGRIRDWLFQSTLRDIGILGRLETKAGALYGAIEFIGGMYDWTETSTGDYTSGVDFKPFLLLSADDIKGQENVINHGMWLLWNGDSVSPEDDDAAYLQALDFAEKFHNDLIDEMDATNNHVCDVDIYVVRPVLRNPDNNPELYYLIMNDVPWTTVE